MKNSKRRLDDFLDGYLEVIKQREAELEEQAFRENRRNTILIGLTGHQYLEAGYVYAPYIPTVITPAIVTSRMTNGLLNRYTKKKINHDFYSAIRIGQ